MNLSWCSLRVFNVHMEIGLIRCCNLNASRSSIHSIIASNKLCIHSLYFCPLFYIITNTQCLSIKSPFQCAFRGIKRTINGNSLIWNVLLFIIKLQTLTRGGRSLFQSEQISKMFQITFHFFIFKATFLWHAATPTVFLAYLQQDGLSQLNGEALVLFILLVINNLDFDDLPALKSRWKDDDQRPETHPQIYVLLLNDNIKRKWFGQEWSTPP